MRTLQNAISELGPWAARELVNVIIDTPAGSRNKYKWDSDSGLFKLSRILPEGLHFPCDFGSIPGTRGEDGDALDVAVLNIAPSFVGCLMTVRPLGVIKAVQWERRRRIQNDRLVAVPVTPVNRPRAHRLSDIDQQRLTDLEQFFSAYNRAQGRRFEIVGRQGRQPALRLIEASIACADRDAAEDSAHAARNPRTASANADRRQRRLTSR
jgi:inorganic pyrophosphatase